MPQPNFIDNPEYAALLKKVLQNKKVTTSKLLEDEKGYAKRKNILRKMKNLEKKGLIKTSAFTERRKKGAYENIYSVDYAGLATLFSKFLYKKHNFIVIKKRWHLTARRFSEEEGKQFEPYIKHYMNHAWIQEQETIRQMFYEMMMISYAYAMSPKKSNGFDRLNAVIRDSLAADRFGQIRKVVPIRIEVRLKNPNEN